MKIEQDRDAEATGVLVLFEHFFRFSIPTNPLLTINIKKMNALVPMPPKMAELASQPPLSTAVVSKDFPF
jgi:hypothetical protein